MKKKEQCQKLILLANLRRGIRLEYDVGAYTSKQAEVDGVIHLAGGHFAFTWIFFW